MDGERNFKHGDPVLVTGGAWEGRTGRIRKRPRSGRATVMMSRTEAWRVLVDEIRLLSEEEFLVREVMQS